MKSARQRDLFRQSLAGIELEFWKGSGKIGQSLTNCWRTPQARLNRFTEKLPDVQRSTSKRRRNWKKTFCRRFATRPSLSTVRRNRTSRAHEQRKIGQIRRRAGQTFADIAGSANSVARTCSAMANFWRSARKILQDERVPAAADRRKEAELKQPATISPTFFAG
ncbi:MAG: hypothetical protein R3C26_08490 [Calditrichia bacterium]